MRLVLLGPPGAGKGTHAKILSEKFKVSHLATGDILRKHIREQSEIGSRAKDIIERGGLVPDELVNEMMAGEVERAGVSKGFILDGYPRTLGQAEALNRFLKSHNAELDAVLNFATSERVIIDRLSGRRICPECGANYHIRNIPPKKEGSCDRCQAKIVQRKDDQPDTIRHRLATYEKETYPLIAYYREKNLLQDVHGDWDVPELQTELKELFAQIGL
ncbi:MAG: adenylate kinase [Candidatus Omnitrophica bacterium]|nr:adenylate kinase [Candidatus Omnitrophota bacterium]